MTLSNIMKFAVLDELITSSPCKVKNASKIVSPEKEYRPPSDIWAVLDELPPHVRIAAVVQFGAALRISEVLGLDWADVDLETGIVHVHHQHLNGVMVERIKNGEERDVMLTTWALDALREHRKQHPGIGKQPIFVNTVGRRMSARNVYDAWGPARERAGVGKVTTHHQRHVDLTEFRAATGDMVRTMKRAGHRDYRSALRYQHVDVAQDTDAVALLSKRTAPKAG
jgi:integrase